uniref:Uncharacterized protein n=1 Tax=Otus sunia TaxID=257818 RepID=A0A8C8AW53_9STRI
HTMNKYFKYLSTCLPLNTYSELTYFNTYAHIPLNQPGTPRDDGEMGGNFLNPFQSESVSI